MATPAHPPPRRSPRGSVDWNTFRRWILFCHRSRRSPRGSVDWNTFGHQCQRNVSSASLPARERGLEPHRLRRAPNSSPPSLPARERGLEHVIGGTIQGTTARVAPRAGAWIGTLSIREASHREAQVAPRAGAWIGTAGMRRGWWRCTGRSPRGSVDWNSKWASEIPEDVRRSPRGSVDWNKNRNQLRDLILRRRSPRGSVDWNNA